MLAAQWIRRCLTTVGTVSLVVLLAACGGDKPDEMLKSASDFLDKNDAKSAIIQVKNALQKNPDLPEARVLLGRALLQSGDPVGAETELRKALALKAPAEQVVPHLAKALLAQRQVKKLVDEFGATELTQPSAQADLKTSLAAAQSALGKSAQSQEALKAALAADPDFGPALSVQARMKAMDKDFVGALAQVETILAKSPKDADAWKLKGDLLWFSEKTSDKALEAYRKALEIRPGHAEAHGAILTSFLRDNKLTEATAQL